MSAVMLWAEVQQPIQRIKRRHLLRRTLFAQFTTISNGNCLMNNFAEISRRLAIAGLGSVTANCLFVPQKARAQPLVTPPEVLVFDVAESLVDLRAIWPLFERLFGDGAVADEWFGETILYSEAETLTNTFTPFGQLGAGVLRMLGRIHNVVISDANVTDLGIGLASLPPHPDVPEPLRKLRAVGYRLVTLTDSSASSSDGLLRAAGLANLFEQHFSAEAVRRYKPARETYEMVAAATNVRLPDLCMITAHPWDVIGARQAGCSASLIERGGVAPLRLSSLKQAEISGPTLVEVAAQLIRLKQA
jgi:2-haloacid dehalogenase